MNLKYLWQYVPETSRWMSRNIMASSVAALLGSCTPLEILPDHQLNTDMKPQMQNVPLPYQSVHEILSWKSRIIEENSLWELLGWLDDSAEKPEEYVDDNGKVFTREQLESSDE